ncbi:MAG: hypothetical protein GX591_16820 [Planctomycetes bacterium]|nr:hypothetical protein [Planctomycetota bacterium]
MNTSPTSEAPVKTARTAKGRQMSLKVDRIGAQCRRQAAAILEVLAGVLSPADAAKALSLSLPAYYKLESRALNGLIQGCQPPARGPRPSPEVELKKLRREHQQLRQELRRYQALARTSQRTVGLPSAPPSGKTDARGRRRRRPTVRALKAVEAIGRIPDDPAQTPVAASPAAG